MTRVRRCPPVRAVAENAYVYKRAVKRSVHQKLRGTTRLRTTASAGVSPTKTAPAGWILVLGPELKRLPSLRGVATLAFGLASSSTSGVREQQSNMSERINDTTAADSAHKHHVVCPTRSPLSGVVYAFYTSPELPSNAKPQDGEGEFTRFTDFTANRMGVYVAPARLRSRPRSRSLGLIPGPLSRGVKSVKRVKPQDGRGVFSPPCRKTGCKFYTYAVTEVVG